MSGSVWMFSDQIDDEDMDFMRHEFVTYSMASDYYRLGQARYPDGTRMWGNL